jgi:thiamine kinase-like enzyme
MSHINTRLKTKHSSQNAQVFNEYSYEQLLNNYKLLEKQSKLLDKQNKNLYKTVQSLKKDRKTSGLMTLM